MRFLAIAFLLLANVVVASAEARTPALQPGREHIPGAQVLMGTVQTLAGYPLRIFVTRPQNAKAETKLPVIFMVGWLSCDSVEAPHGPEDGFAQLLFDLASRSGFATYRVEKPGVGDSGGPKCGDADFNAELAGYRAAFAALGDIDFLDTSRVYVLGFSNGGGFAPLVTGGRPVRGYMLLSGWYKTWLEHMLEHERRRMKLAGLSESEINARMKKYATFYNLYLNAGQTPGEIIQRHPELKEIWYDQPEHQYGRPAAYYQQLQSLNLAEAWEKVDAPVLAIHGEYDWVMSADDHKLLAQELNARRPASADSGPAEFGQAEFGPAQFGSAEFMEWPRADHVLFTHARAEQAFHHDPDAKYDPKLSDFVLDWLKRH